jgi:hypothetical protein
MDDAINSTTNQYLMMIHPQIDDVMACLCGGATQKPHQLLYPIRDISYTPSEIYTYPIIDIDI